MRYRDDYHYPRVLTPLREDRVPEDLVYSGTPWHAYLLLGSILGVGVVALVAWLVGL